SAISTPSFLYFASDGHPGYGGFDFFLAKSSSFGDTVVYNLNYPFNSVKDDCFLTFNGDDIYWSSNRDGGKGGFDIYTGRNISSIALASRLTRKNRNDSRMVTLTSRTAKSENLSLLASRNEETIDYNDLTYERRALVNKMVENRLSNTQNEPAQFPGISNEEFEWLNEISRLRFQAMLLKERYASRLLTEVTTDAVAGQPISITGQLVDSLSGFGLSGARVLLTNEYGEILKITNTNREGYFRFTGVTADTKLFIRLENGSFRTTDACVKHITTQGSGNENSLYVENVYFDFDHYVIRPEAAQVLHELAAYLMMNPGSQVEIYAFADDRGSSAYNFELTQKRGEAVAAFLTKNGVDATSLAIVPKGKQNLRRSSDELQRQFNRRAEFHINGVKESLRPSAKTYILKKEADWALISRLTGISKEELMSLNGTHKEVVKAFQPIRLPMTATPVLEELFYVGI
ncbi:MAG TPA: OmpA family protein, partial [Chryseosolibacter sp.]|nr:OmpA family protein [Chryseosolibacter sp.]